MEFGNRELLYFFLVPLGILIITLMGVKKRESILRFFNYESRKNLEILKGFLYFLGSSAVVVAILSPQIAKDEEMREVKGLDIYILIDTSKSMMAEDVYPNRLEKGKKAIENLLGNLKGDRIGFIPFSDSAYIQLPLTDDYKIAKNYLEAIDSQLISGGGTDLISALKIANLSFKDSSTENKIVLILSDGGEEDDKVKEYLKNSELKVFSIGIGGDKPIVIPEYDSGIKRGFIKDKNGELATTALNSKLLKNISENGYYEVNNIQNNSEKFLQDIAFLERDALRKESGKNYEKYFQFPLFLGIIIILIAYLLRGGIKYEK